MAGLRDRSFVITQTQIANGKIESVLKAGIGDLLLVNGRLQPTVRIRPGETQHWRLLNAASDVFLQLELSAGAARQASGAIRAAPSLRGR